MASTWKTFVMMLTTTLIVNGAMMLIFLRVGATEQRIVVVTTPAVPTTPSPPPTYDDAFWQAASAAPDDEPVHRRELHSVGALSPSRIPSLTPHGKPFYLVTSPESNGNRFLVKLITSAGCFGQSGHQQPFDDTRRYRGSVPAWPNRIKEKKYWGGTHEKAPCAVMHRSVPHAGVWPDLPALVKQVEQAGFEPRILVSWRPEDIARASQVSQKHVRTENQAQTNIFRAQRHIVDALGKMPDVWWRWVLYEQLGHQHYLDWLFEEQMGLTLPADHPKFEDRDSKHFH